MKNWTLYVYVPSNGYTPSIHFDKGGADYAKIFDPEGDVVCIGRKKGKFFIKEYVRKTKGG